MSSPIYGFVGSSSRTWGFYVIAVAIAGSAVLGCVLGHAAYACNNGCMTSLTGEGMLLSSGASYFTGYDNPISDNVYGDSSENESAGGGYTNVTCYMGCPGSFICYPQNNLWSGSAWVCLCSYTGTEGPLQMPTACYTPGS